MKAGEKIQVCHCGYLSDPHYFRHHFEPSATITRAQDEVGDCYIADANDWKSRKQEGKCTFPQCSAGKPLHGPIIKHEYSPSDVYYVRRVRFKLPLDTRCRVCKESLDEHESLTHAFTTKVDILNKTEHDTVAVLGKEDQTIILDES